MKFNNKESTMKGIRKISTLAVALLVSIPFTSAAQIPVTDVAQITLTQSNQAANVAKYLEMIAQYKQQIEQMKRQYESLTGSRGMGSLLNDPAYASYLPAEWQDVYDRVRRGGYEGLTGSARAMRDANKLFDACASRANDEKQVCERRASKAAQDKAFATNAFDKAQERWDQIAGLIQAINGTEDPKAIAELQARIDGEQAAIQNEQIKLRMYQMIAAAEDRLIEQQEQEAIAKSLSRRGYVTPLPVDFEH